MLKQMLHTCLKRPYLLIGVVPLAVGLAWAGANAAGGSDQADMVTDQVGHQGQSTSEPQVPVRAGTPVEELPNGMVPESSPGPRGQTFGRVPQEASGAPPVDALAASPDFIAVYSADGTEIAGYVRKTDLFGTNPAQPMIAASNIPVYDVDGSTVVGTWVPGAGFVPQGQDPSTASTLPAPPNADLIPGTEDD